MSDKRDVLLVCLCTLLAGGVRAEELPPDLCITLGVTNSGEGLSVPAGGDGANVPDVVGGTPARRVQGPGARYLYVAVNHPAYLPGPRDLYVTAEVYDAAFGRLALQYDKAAATPTLESRYAAAEGSLLQLGGGTWRRAVFHLPAARLAHGQNGGADFRLDGPRLAVRAITVSPRRPADYAANQSPDAATLRALAVKRPPGMELTFGNDAHAADAAVFKALSVTSVESYVDWAGVEPEPGRWVWDKWDKQVAILQAAGLKWVPFLIAGPAYATPLWFQQGPDACVYRCLEHGKDSKVQSLFNPRLRPHIERFLEAFAARYRDTGVIESVLLGVTGIYGESIYPAGPEGGWTARLTGDYHNHAGWWMGDPLAAQAFRAELQKRYGGSVAALNAAWGSRHGSFDALAPCLPDRASGDRARADLVEWYQQAMTDWAQFWVTATRHAFPRTPIYLCTGGDGTPELGADFTAQAAAIAPLGAGIRITNEGSDYTQNFTLTREAATATRLYGTFCGFEPASGVDAAGVVARIYNATASGARQLHDYTPNTLGHGADALASFRANAEWLVLRTPRPEAAVYLARETWALEPGALGRLYARARRLRDLADLDFATRRSVADGVLRAHRLLVLTDAPVLEPAAADAIEAWVRAGGTLLAVARSGELPGSRLYDLAAWRGRLFADAGSAVPPAPALLRTALAGPAPAHWRLAVGDPAAETWLQGAWHGSEGAGLWPEWPGATMRWTGGQAKLPLPVSPGDRYHVRLNLYVPKQALGPSGVVVRVAGEKIGTLNEAGRQDPVYTFVAGESSRHALPDMELSATPWRPSDQREGGGDRRLLGVAVRAIELWREGAEAVPVAGAALRAGVDTACLARCQRTVGQGRTVLWAGKDDADRVLSALFVSLLTQPADGVSDGRFATPTTQGVLWLDTAKARIWQEGL